MVRTPIGRGFVVSGIAVSLLFGTVARPAAAQHEETSAGPEWPGWVGQFTVLSANAALGGLSAGLISRLRGGSFADGFVGGMTGGSMTYLGKRIAVERFDGAGLIGRQFASVGTSMTRNAADGYPLASRLQFPLGPVRVYLDRGERVAVQAKVDVTSLAMVGYGIAHSDLELDLGASLSAGAPVFRAYEHLLRTGRDTLHARGTVIEGVVVLSDLPWRESAEGREIFAHERVHVLQRDQIVTLWAEPLASRAAQVIPGGRALARFLDLHPSGLFFLGLRGLFPEYERRPWEMEAHFLAEQ